MSSDTRTLTQPTRAREVDPSLMVNEVFGPTFQGEGPNLGRLAAFVRLGACNLSCSWCDTPYTWDGARFDLRAEMTRLPVREIARRVRAAQPQLVIITGGEPLLWQGKPGWTALLTDLARDFPLEIETNGTITPNGFTARTAAHFEVSPKLANSGLTEPRRIEVRVLREFAELAQLGRASLKVVVEQRADLDELERLVKRVAWPAGRVYVMPQSTTTDEILARSRDLADAVLDKGFGMTTRLHVLLWGTERGR